MECNTFYVELEGIELKGQVYVPDVIPAPALCLCHGMPRGGPADPGDRGYAGLAERFVREGFVTITFNFRGAGESEGNFDISGWTRDLKAILDHICCMDGVDKSRVSLMGFSAGAAVSIYIAAQDRRVSSVIACACPDISRLAGDRELAESVIANYREMGVIKDAHFPPSIEDWMEGFSEVYSGDWIEDISPRPILIIHGDEDDVVPPSSAWSLYERADDPREILIIKGTGHRIRTSDEAMDYALNWLKSRMFGD
ncbi:MAG: alpha/beta fold hydrolase [Chloroflexota bacterium]|nr:alpha/beta fold hydrolase [Chloroflexota bacterium]